MTEGEAINGGIWRYDDFLLQSELLPDFGVENWLSFWRREFEVDESAASKGECQSHEVGISNCGGGERHVVFACWSGITLWLETYENQPGEVEAGFLELSVEKARAHEKGREGEQKRAEEEYVVVHVLKARFKAFRHETSAGYH